MNNITTLPFPSLAEQDDQLAAEITMLAGQINAANYRLLRLIAEFDDRKAWSGGGTVRSCAHWLNWRCGIALGAAREKVRVAHCLSALPLTDAAFASGELSYSKVRALTRVATPDNEDYLLMIARHGTASHMEQVVRKYQGVQRSMARDDEHTELDQRDDRKLVYYQDDDGMWVIHARLPAEEGSIVVKALEAVANPIQAQAQTEAQEKERERDSNSEEDPPAEKGVSAETFSEDVDQQESTPYGELLAQTRADALVTVAEEFLANCGSQSEYVGLKGSERCQIMLHVNIDALRVGVGGAEPHCNLDENRWISPKTARRLACDASLVTVLENDRDEVLNIGRRARTVPASIRRALTIRDQTCRFPGCCESRHVDAHHIRHWADGGETSLENLVVLCRYHHGQLHRGAFEIQVKKSSTGEGAPTLQFTAASGQQIETSFHPQFSPTATNNAEDALAQAAPDVNASTCVPHWEGEACDYHMAIEGLLRRDGAF